MLKQIDLVIVPSVKFESFGRVAVEAMALKKPIITSNYGGLKEVNINKITGFTVNIKDKKKFSNKIIKLMTNKNKRSLFGIREKKIIEELYIFYYGKKILLVCKKKITK